MTDKLTPELKQKIYDMARDLVEKLESIEGDEYWFDCICGERHPVYNWVGDNWQSVIEQFLRKRITELMP